MSMHESAVGGHTEFGTMTKKEQRLFNDALALLTSPAVLETAKCRRAQTSAARSSRFSSDVDTVLKAIVDKAQSRLLPRLLKLHSPRLIPEHVLLNLSRGWIGAFVDEAACTRSPLKTLAQKHAAALLAEARVPVLTMRSVVPLMNFSAGRRFSLSGRLSGKEYTCRFQQNPSPLDPAALGFGVLDATEAAIASPLPDMSTITKWVVLIDVRLPKNEDTYCQHNSVEQNALQRGLITALRLFRDGAVDGSVSFLSKDSLYLAGRAVSTSHARGHRGDEYTLLQGRIPAFRRSWATLGGYLLGARPLPPRIQIALEYFESSYAKDILAAFLDLCISLEALFDVQFEQRYRLPLRVAALLGGPVKGALETHETVKGIWDLRNKIAHGSSVLRRRSFRDRVQKETPWLRSLVRTAILKHVRLSEGLGDAYEKTIHEAFEREFILPRLGSKQLLPPSVQSAQDYPRDCQADDAPKSAPSRSRLGSNARRRCTDSFAARAIPPTTTNLTSWSFSRFSKSRVEATVVYARLARGADKSQRLFVTPEPLSRR